MLIIACEFDNTLVAGNVSVAVREAFAPENWVEMEGEYLDGKYTIEENLIRQYAEIKGVTKEDIEDFVLGEVVIRYAVDEFLDYCNGEGIRLVIVSSGLDIYIKPIMELIAFGDFEIYSGSAIVTSNGIEVSYADPSGNIITKGFKESHIQHFKEQGHTVIFIGDGESDVEAAKQADYVVARDYLARYCETNKLPFDSFDTFGEVGQVVEKVRQQLAAEQG